METSFSDLPALIEQPIEPLWPLDVAAQVVALRELRALDEARVLALEGQDTLGVHKVRVACRRLGVLFATLKGVWPKKQLKPLRKALSRLAGAVGEARDLDVEILRLCERIGQVHDQEDRALRWLWNRAVGARKREQSAVVSALESFADEGWPERLEQFFSTRPDEPVPALTVAEALPGLVEVEVDRVWEFSRSVLDPSCRVEQHDLRLACKSLRYLLESFATCLPPKPRKLIKPLRRCQALLGDLHDGEVQARQLVGLLSAHGKGLRRTLREAVDTDAETEALGEIAHRVARVCHDLPAEGLSLCLFEMATRRDQMQAALVERWQRMEERGYRQELLAAVQPPGSESSSS